jgi:hypothetical protein
MQQPCSACGVGPILAEPAAVKRTVLRPWQQIESDISRYSLLVVTSPMVAPKKTHLELHQLGVEQFLEMLRFEQQGILEELPVTLGWVRDDFFN